MSKKQSHLTAVIAERLFGVVILLLLITIIIDFIFVTNFLKSQATTTEALRQQSDASDSDIAKLKSADAWLNQHKDVVDRASAVVAQSKLYQYQNQIIEDFNDYASRTGLSISGYTFTPPDTAAAAGTTKAPAASTSTASAGAAKPTPPPTSTSTTTATTTVTPAGPPAGVNSTSVNVTFGDKVGYQNFLNMLRLLEQNVTRMQVTDVSLSPDIGDPQKIINPNITVTVYTR